MMVDEFRNIMAQNSVDIDEDYGPGDCFVEGLRLMSEYLGKVNVEFTEDNLVVTERAERLIAHNISPEAVERLHALGWFVEYEGSVMVVFQL